jgi:DNA-binding HxlR family transcriptional regulator
MTSNRKQDCRSHCPVNFGLEVYGDKWSLLIVRDIVFWGKKTYGEFLKSEEGFSTNILASRLLFLEEAGILNKTPHPVDKRRDFYGLTEKGIDLIPLILEIAVWSAKYDPLSYAKKMGSFASRLTKDRKKVGDEVKELVRRGGWIFS